MGFLSAPTSVRFSFSFSWQKCAAAAAAAAAAPNDVVVPVLNQLEVAADGDGDGAEEPQTLVQERRDERRSTNARHDVMVTQLANPTRVGFLWVPCQCQ